MPDILTHILCGEEVACKINDYTLKSEIEKRKKLFNLGTQGPDFYFYYNFWPWISKGSVNELGSLMHSKKTGQFFMEGFTLLKEASNNDDYYNLLVYLTGFICHFSLDSNTHPYIYYHCGIDTKKSKETKKYTYYHQKLESTVDTILFKRKKGLDAYKYTVYKLIDSGKRLPESVLNFHRHTADKLYNISVSNDTINKAYRDMINSLKLLYDPHNIKKSVIKGLSNITGKNISLGRPMHPKYVEKEIDYLNTEQKLWNHPCVQEEQYIYSFIDLFDKAILQSLKIINGIMDNRSPKSINTIFKDVSYLTNKPCEPKYELKYFKCIFE